MIRLNIHEAKTHLSRVLEELAEDERIIICKRNVPIAEVRKLPGARTKRRPIGRRAGELEVPKSFFDPLPDDIIADFES